MQIPIYCGADQRLADLLVPPLEIFVLTPYADWGAFHRARKRAACSVLVIDRLESDDVFGRFAASSRQGRDGPTILVTARDPENVRRTASVCVDEIVWIEDIRRELPDAIRRVVRLDLVGEVAAAVQRAPGLPPRLREALLVACRADPAPRTVASLARAVGCDRTTLSRQWRAGHASRRMRLQDFLDWLLLVRATEARLAGLKWEAAAERVGVHLRSLTRTVRRLTGGGLSGLATEPGAGGTMAAQWIASAFGNATFCPSVPHNVN
jgi:hypothetical protein